MTNRLSFWIGLATALCLTTGTLLVGVGWTTLIVLIQVPAVLAVLLLLRAAALGLLGGSTALEWRGRTVLAGPAGLLVPAAFLIAWVFARETGVVKAQLSFKTVSHQTGSHSQDWEDRVPQRAILQPGLTVTAPAGVLGDSFRSVLRHQWSAGDGSQAHGEIALDCEPPFAWMPLWKSADVKCRVTVELQMRRPDTEVARCTTITMNIEGTWTAGGLLSRRDFHEWLGADLGKKVRDVIAERIRKLHEPK